MRGTLRGYQHDLPPAHPHPATYPKQGVNRKAVAGFVLTLIGVVIAPFAFSTVGLVLSVIARGEIARNPAQRGKGFATAALIIGALGLVTGIGVLVAEHT